MRQCPWPTPPHAYALWLGLSCAWLWALLFAVSARADPPSKLGTIELAPHVSYEEQRLAQALGEQKLVPEPSPAGKRIAFVRVVRDDVFVKDEIWPLWWNWFHGRTREDVVRRELLFEEGGRYDEARIEETMRNLRGMGIFTLVRIVPVKTARPDEVGILVQTRDLWSLRIEADYNVTHQVINTLFLRLTELNAFGQNKLVAADVTMHSQNYLLSESATVRRLLGSSLRFTERAGLVFNRLYHEREGEIASLSLGQPYYRLSQRFAWSASFVHDNRVNRNTSDGEILQYPNPNRTSPPHALQVYRFRVEDAYLTAAYRTGEQIKQTVSAGWDFRQRKASPTTETDLPDSVRDDFYRNVLPLSRTDHGPTLSYEMFTPRWATFVNLATYGQSENVRIGPSFLISTRVPLRALGSTANAWSLSGNAGWIFAPKGYLIDLSVSGAARLQQGLWIDQRAVFQLRGATPVFSIFRFVMRSYLELRKNDTLKTYVTLGADNGLRGYFSQAVGGLGANRMLTNFELRTLPIRWQAVQLGGVLFYDLGSVFDQTKRFYAYHAVGIGLRLLFPQFSRQPYSFDGGMALDPYARHIPLPTFSSAQVVPLTAAEDGP